MVLVEDFQEEVAQVADGKIKEIKQKLGNNLISIVKYKVGFIENILFILNKIGIEELDKIKADFEENHLFLTKKSIINGTDVFPLEFYNIKTGREILYGQDIFKDLEFDKENIRRELEFEFRSKLLHLRQEYLSLKENDIQKLIFSAIPTLTPILKGMAFLKGIKVNENNIIEKVGDAFEENLLILKDIEILKKKNEKIKNKEEYIQKLMKILKNLGDKLDKYDE